MRKRVVIAAVLLAGCLTGCRGRHAAAHASPATQKLPAAATRSPAAGQSELFQDPQHGFAVRYPANWTLRQDPENVFTADARANDETGPELSIAVPNLPPHVPGMIPLG